MTPEKQNTNADILEKGNKEAEKLNPKLENEADKTLAGEILAGYKGDPSLSSEEKLKICYNNHVDELITKNLGTLEQTKIDQLKALKSQESEGKSPQEILTSLREIKELIGTDVAEANKNNSDKLVQQTAAKQNQEVQKQSEFITQLKEAIKVQAENQDKKRQENQNMLANNNGEVLKEQTGADLILAGFPDSKQ